MSEPKFTIVIGCDDAGTRMRDVLAADLRRDERVAAVIDVGVAGNETTAYPHIAVTAARMVAEGKPTGLF